MPMPAQGSWPPPVYHPAYTRYRDWNAWYTGDPDLLRDVYFERGSADRATRSHARRYPGQYAGGVLGWFSRWLWGAPTSPNSTDGRVHVPLPADLAATAANLLFSEPPKLTAEATATQDRVEHLFEDGLAGLLLHAAEAASALGDVYLRPVVDRDVWPDRAMLTTVHADGALPVIRWGRLLEVTFWSLVHADHSTHIRLLEHHDVVNGAGRITYALHEGTPDRLGRPIPLTELEGTAYLADLVDETGSQATGLAWLDVVRVPNSGPQRIWRHTPTLKYLGRSDFDGSEQLFDRLDDCWTSWMQDLHLARGRIIVPDYMLHNRGPGHGAMWDPYQEVYSSINAAPNQGGNPITPVQFAIRHVEHQATADAITALALRHAGMSPQTMGMQGGDAAVTATEIQARERQSFTTRGNRIQVWRPAIAEAIELLLAVERVQFGARAEPERPNVEFGDSVSESPETTARTLQLLAAAEAVSVDTRVRMVHPDWDDPQVAAEVDRIHEDSGASVQDPETFTGAPPPDAEDEGQGDETDEDTSV